jgi:hypothetical protein
MAKNYTPRRYRIEVDSRTGPMVLRDLNNEIILVHETAKAVVDRVIWSLAAGRFRGVRFIATGDSDARN